MSYCNLRKNLRLAWSICYPSEIGVGRRHWFDVKPGEEIPRGGPGRTGIKGPAAKRGKKNNRRESKSEVRVKLEPSRSKVLICII